MDAIFPFLFLLIIGIVVFVILKTGAKRKEQFRLLAQQAGLQMTGGGFSNVVLQGVHKGYTVIFTFTPAGKNTPPSMTAGYFCELPITVTLRPQSMATTLKTTFGLGRDLQIGDKTVDDAFEIDGPDDPGLRRFLGDVDVRKVLLNLHAHQLAELQITGQGLSYRAVINESKLDSEFLTRTTEILRWISVLVHRHGTDLTARALDTRPALEAATDGAPESWTESVIINLSDPVSEGVGEPDSASESVFVSFDEPVADTGSEPESESTSTSEPASVEGLLDQLKQDLVTPDEAGRQLRRLGPDAIAQSVKGLNDYQLQEKLEAALRALGSAAVPALVAALEDSMLAYQVTELLIRASPDMHQGLVQELSSITNERALTKALEVCTRCKPAGGAEAIEPFLQHESFLVRYEAERALVAINED